MKKLKNITQKTLLSLSCVFAFLLAAAACFFALEKTTTAFAASNGVYGEITLNKTTVDGYSYSLIIAGNGYTGTGFVTGSNISIYVAVDKNTNGKTTFVDGNWNYMLSSLTINSQTVSPNQRIELLDSNNSFNQNAGAYALDGSRYLVHTLEVGSTSLSISAEFSFVERISVSGYHNDNHKSELDFVYNAIDDEDLSDTITGKTFVDAAKEVDDTANHFDGFFDSNGNKLYDQAITRAASAAQKSKTTSYFAQSYSTKTITIGTTTLSPIPNDVGGTAYVSTSYAFLGNNTTTTKYFVSGSTEDFVLFSGTNTFTAQAADGYTFVGWYNDKNIQTATKINDPAATAETTIIAVFAKTYNISVEVINGSYSGRPANYYEGERVSLTASSTNSGSTFLGWYKNGTKVENDNSETFSFTVGTDVKNCTLTAIYSSAISLGISIVGEAQIAGDGTTTLNLNQALASALKLSYQNQGSSTTTLTLANGGLTYSNDKLSCKIPAGEQITLTFNHGNDIAVSNIALSTLSIAFEQQNGITTATFNAIAEKLTITIPLQAQAKETDFSSYTTNVTYASTLSGTKNWVMFTVTPFSGYALKDVKFGQTSVAEFCGKLIDASELSSLNQKLFGATENKYLSQENLFELLTTGAVNGTTTTLNVQTAKTNTITVTTTCESELLSTPYVGIVQNEDLVKTAQIANGSSFTISAQNTNEIGGTTYIFSHFLLGGNYLAGRANANGQALVITNGQNLDVETTTLTLTANGSAEFCAVYRKANSISAQVKINSQERETTNAISATAFGGTAFDFDLLPTNEQITITASYISASVSFSKFILTINGNTQEIKSSEFSLTLAETDIVSLVAQYVENIIYNPTDADFSTTLSTALLTYKNETYSFGSTEIDDKVAGEVSVSSETPAFGEQISFAAKPYNNFVFVGWARIDKGSTPTFADITEFSSTFTTTADDSKCVVAVFAQTIQISVISSSGADTTITNTKTDEQTTNHMFTYAGAPLSISNNGANFIGYYNMGKMSTRLSEENSTYGFTATDNQNIIALFGNNTLNVSVATNFGSTTEGGTFAVSFSDGRNSLSGQTETTQVFATQHGKNITLNATAASGYTFLGWFESTDTSFASPISTNPELAVEQVGSRNLVAHFAQKVSVSTSFSGQGIISGLPQNVYMGQTLTISATALNGYKFDSLTVDGIDSNNKVVGNVTISATFAARPLVSVGAFVMQQGDCPIIVGGSVPSTITINNEITKNAYVDSGATATITVTVSEDYQEVYQFVNFLVNGIATSATSQNATSTTLTLSNITANTAVVAVFEKLVSVSTSVQTINPTGTSTVGGSISSVFPALANGKGIVGQTYTFTADANAGYEFSGFVIDGNFVPTASTANSISLCLADNNITVTAVFTKLITITTSVTGYGSIKINGESFTSGNTLPYGQVATIEFEPTSGYILTAVSGISITTNDGKSGFFTPTTALNISATYTQKSKLTLTTNNDSVNWDYNVPIIEVDYDNVVYGSASYNGPFGYTQILIGGSFVVPSGTNVTLTAPFKTDNGSKVFVGFFINGTTSFVGSSYEYSNGNVTATYTLSKNKTILARYEDATTIRVRSANGTSVNTTQDKFSLAINGNSANYVISASELKKIYSDDDELINSYLTLTVPKSLPLTITAKNTDSNFGWYFAANQSGQFYYNYNKVSKKVSESDQTSFSFIASELSGFASGYALLAGYNASETVAPDTSASATLEIIKVLDSLANNLEIGKEYNEISDQAQAVENGNYTILKLVFDQENNKTEVTYATTYNGSYDYDGKDGKIGEIEINGNTITANADDGYHFAYWEVKIAVAASNLYIAIPGESTITTATESKNKNILKITDSSGTIYSGYAKAIRPVFKQGSAPATPQEIVPTTYSVEVSSAFGTPNFTYNQVSAGSSTTITINGLTDSQYVSISDSLRAYLTGFSATGTAGTKNSNTYTITNINANTIVVANFELRANHNGEWVALGSTQTLTAGRETAGEDNNDVTLFTGFTANAMFKPRSASYSDGTTTFSFILTNSITTAKATRSAKKVTISSSQSSCTVYTPFGTTTSQIDCYTDAIGKIPLVALASADYVFVSYSDDNNGAKSTSAADVLEIGTTSTISSITALFAQKANLLLVSNAEGTTATITGTIAVDQTPTITVSASDYSFKNWSWSTNSGTTTGTTNTISYTIPASSTITLTFAKQYDLTTSVQTINPTDISTIGGSISVSPELANGKGTQGTTYTFTATPENDNYIFTGWKVNNVLVSSNSTLSITLTGDTAITAVFEYANAITIPQNSLYITSFGTTGQGTSITLANTETANVLVRASLNNVLSSVTGISQQDVLGKTGVLLSSVSSSITAIEQSRDLPVVLATSNIADVQIKVDGTTITYTLPEDAASSFEDADQNNLNRVLVFEGWYENGEKQSTDASYTYAGVAVEARFAQYFRISNAATANGTITISTEAEAKGTNFDFYPAGASISVTADAAENYFAKSLTINNQVLHGAQATLAQTIGATFALSSFTEISAEFGELVTLIFNISDNLNRSTIGGTISVSSSSLPQALTSAYYDQSSISVKVEKGSSVVVVFNPILGNTLAEVVGQTLTGNTLTFTANGDQKFYVNFVKTYTAQGAAISLDGTELSAAPAIEQTNNTISVSASIQITKNETDYKLIAIAIVSESGKISYHYLDSLSKTGNTATLNNLDDITQNIVAIAIYGKKLQIAVSSTDNIAEISVPQDIYQNDTVKLTAPEVSNYIFTGWYLSNDSLLSTATTFSFVAGQNMKIIAKYAQKVYVSIEVHNATRNNSGEIDIASSSADSTACSIYGNGTYLSTGSITLYAHAANGYKFVGWYNSSNERVSESAIYTTTAQKASTIAKAVFEQVYSATITINLDSTKVSTTVGAIIHHNGTYAATTADGQVVIQNLTNGSTILVRSQANGYTLATDMSDYETDDDGNYIVHIQGANISLVLSYTPSKNVLTVESSTNYINTHTPTSEDEGSFTINGTDFDEENPEIEFDGTKSFTFAITLPTYGSYSYVAQIYKNGVLVSTLSSNGDYELKELSSSATISVVFAELVNVSVETTPVGNDGTIYINGTQTTSASVPLGSTVTIYATNGMQYEFVEYTQNSTELSTHPTYTFTASESTTITAEFALKQIEFAVYFPANVRTAIDSTGTAPTPVLNIYKKSGTTKTLIATIDSSFTEQTNGNITIKVDGDYVIISVPYGYNDGAITAQFEQATKRADITLNNTTISSANTIPATNNSFNILVGEAATNKTIMLSYMLYAAITITSDGRAGEGDYGDFFAISNGAIQLSTNYRDSEYSEQVKTAFFPVGETFSLAATNKNSTIDAGIPGSSTKLDFDNFIVLTCPYLPSYIVKLGELSESDSFYQWQNGSPNRPGRQSWIDLLKAIGYTTLSSDKYLVTADATLVADYLNLTENGNNYIFAVLNNNLTNGSFNHAQQSETTASHASTSVTYSIIPESQSGALNVTTASNGNFNQAGLTNNNTYKEGTAGNNTIQSGDINRAISLISKYSNISEATYQTATKKANSNSQTTYNGSLGYKNTNDYSTKPIAATYSSIEPQTGLTFLGYYIKATNFGAREIQGTTTAFSIKPDGKTIIDSTGSAVDNLQNYIKIADPSAIINVVGPYQIVALFELNLYQINATELTANKTTTNSDGKQQVKINDVTYIVEDQTITAQGYSDNLYKKVPDAGDLFQGLEKIDDYFIVYTNNASHSGKIKGSLIYEHGDTTSINAYTHMFGEFAGYQFANEITNPSQATITTPESEEQETTTIENPNKAILQPNRNKNNVAYPTQELGFNITSDQNLNIYFTGLRYKVTLQFVEYTNQTDDTQTGAIEATNADLALLFNVNTDTSETTNEIDSAFFNLGNVYNYVSYNTKMFNNIKEGDQPIFSLKITSKDNDIGEIVATPQIKGNQVSASFYVEAQAGSGFAGFNIAYTNANVAGSTYIVSPEDNAQTQTYNLNDQINRATFLNKDYTYNTSIDCESNAELIKNMRQSLTLYLVQNCSLTNINVNNSELQRQNSYNYNTYDSNMINTYQKTIQNKLTNGANLIVVKGAKRFASILSSYAEDNTIINTKAYDYIMNGVDFNSITNEEEKQALTLYIEILSTPYLSFISHTSTNDEINNQKISIGDYFAKIGTKALSLSDLSGAKFKVQDPQTGRYIELEPSGENFRLTKGSTITSKTDYNKWSDENKSDYKLKYENDLITISYTKNGEPEPVKMSAPLIVSITRQLETKLKDEPQTIEVQLITLPTQFNGNIPATQDDMVFASTSVNSIVVPEVAKGEFIYDKDNINNPSDFFRSLGNWITGKMVGTTMFDADPAKVVYQDTKFYFAALNNGSAAQSTTNTKFVFENSGDGKIGSITNNPNNLQSLWDIISYSSIITQLQGTAAMYADYYNNSLSDSEKKSFVKDPTTFTTPAATINLFAYISIDREIVNNQLNITVNAESNSERLSESKYTEFNLVELPYSETPYQQYSTFKKIAVPAANIVLTAFTVVSVGKIVINLGKFVLGGFVNTARAAAGYATATAKSGIGVVARFTASFLLRTGIKVLGIVLNPIGTVGHLLKFSGFLAVKALVAATAFSGVSQWAQDVKDKGINSVDNPTIQQYLRLLQITDQYSDFITDLQHA